MLQPAAGQVPGELAKSLDSGQPAPRYHPIMTAVLPRLDAKALGAYYTDEEIAAFLVTWAIRNG